MSTPKARSKRRRRIIVSSILILLVAAVGGFFGFKRRDTTIAVQTDTVARRNITEIVVANGRIQPVLQVVINPEVSGEIVDLPVKEGQFVEKGDLLVKIKPDNYLAQVNSAEANFKGAVAGENLARANLEKARLEYERIKQLHENLLVSDSDYLAAKTSLDVAQASYESSNHQREQARAVLDRAKDDLSKTTIVAPIPGTVTKLRSQRGERVVGTAMMAGTEIMTIADLGAMEARVDIGEIDVVLIQLGQKARLEVEAFRDRKFTGTVTEIANAAKGAASSTQQNMGGQQQEATKFEVKILIAEKEPFRPGMSVSAEIETRSKTNILAVPIMAVTTRMATNAPPPNPDQASEQQAQGVPLKKKEEQGRKADEVVFLVNGDSAKKAVVKTGISDDSFIEVTEGLKEGDQIISGGYAAVSRQLEDGKKIKKAGAEEKNGARRDNQKQT